MTKEPYTAIVVGAGCSVGLGVPPMPAFMDKVYETLANKEGEKHLLNIRQFLQTIKPSGAYVRTQMLNIEELYGMVDLAVDLEAAGTAPRKNEQPSSRDDEFGLAPDPMESLARDAREALNRAIFRIAINAGSDFQSHPKRFPGVNCLDMVKRESSTETIRAWDQGSSYTNLLAYLCLASHKDSDESRPLFIQFNWDLALDRALCYLNLWDDGQKIPPWYRDSSDDFYVSTPRVARPHGGLCWVDTERSENKHNCQDLERVEAELNEENCERLRYEKGKHKWNTDVWIDSAQILTAERSTTTWSDGKMMAIVPPTWRKQSTKAAYQDQWSFILRGLRNVRRIVFIGYSLPQSDLYFRHFLALALAKNDYSPKIYVWNPGIRTNPEVRDSYLDLFAPLAREGRLFAIDGYFGNPALFDLERALNTAEPLSAQG
ncbi:hypothetical protein [Ectothiorhodospira sp. BSL-9]|uniref:hypothetical protein n=1 Tax=Ectothiorhodospira sp. BSL-9 TaxID=1442136 RepID=UPI0009EDF611|nr:hypothetical protein [Ectothiorhodospira sp. BSL-9]